MARRKDDQAVAGLVLDAEGVEPVTFPGFPGRFVPGVPVALTELERVSGVAADDLVALAAELGLPLAAVEVVAGEGALPPVDNHVGAAEPVGLVDGASEDAGQLSDDGEPAEEADA